MMAIVVTSLLISLLFSSTVLGCGSLPSGQEKILRFTVSNIKLALPMVYTEHPTSRSTYPNVSENAMQAQTVVRNLIMRAVTDVLEQQGRAAGLSGAIISTILDQLRVDITYESLKCATVSVLNAAYRITGMNNCLVVSDIVTTICTHMAMNMCQGPPHLMDIPPQHLTINGTLRIGNIIMAGWTDQMWRIMLNRVIQALSSGAFRTSFQSALVNIV